MQGLARVEGHLDDKGQRDWTCQIHSLYDVVLKVGSRYQVNATVGLFARRRWTVFRMDFTVILISIEDGSGPGVSLRSADTKKLNPAVDRALERDHQSSLSVEWPYLTQTSFDHSPLSNDLRFV